MEVNLKFLLCFTLYLRAIFQVHAPGGLYLEGQFNGGFFVLPVWGGLYLEGLIHGGAYFWNFTVLYVTGIPLWDTASMNFLFYFNLLQVKNKEEKKLHRLNWKKKNSME